MDQCEKIICPHCAQYFKKEKYLKEHLRNIHPQDENIKRTMFPCKHCSSFFKTVRRLQMHTSRYHSSQNEEHEKENKKVICDYCGINFTRKCHLLNHIQNIHMRLRVQEKKLISCKLCNSQFKNELWLGRHIAKLHIKLTESHEDNHVASEDIFKDVFKHLKALDMQKDILSQALEATDVNLIPEIDIEKLKVSSLNGKNFYHCDFCTKNFPKLSLLKRHLVLHGNQKPYECSLCHIKFRYSSSLRAHAKEKHKFKEKNNRNDVFLQQFQKYVNKMKSIPTSNKVKNEKYKKKKRNATSDSNKSVVQNQNLSMPMLYSSLESEFVAKDWPTAKLTSDTEVHTQPTNASTALKNRDPRDVADETLSYTKAGDCLNKADSGESVSTCCDNNCVMDENYVNTRISGSIEDILDNETSLDVSLGDLPGNCSFENISLSEIDVQRIDTDNSTVEQNSEQQNLSHNSLTVEECCKILENANIINDIDVSNDMNDILQCTPENDFQVDEFVNKSVTDSIFNAKQSTAITGSNKFTDSYTSKVSRDTDNNICNEYALEDTYSTSIPNQLYILNDEIYIGQLVTIQNGDVFQDDLSMITESVELQENCSNCTVPRNETIIPVEDKTLNTGDNNKDDIQDILNYLNIKVVSNASENESIEQVSDVLSDNVHFDHTYIKNANLQNIDIHPSELVDPNVFLIPQNIIRSDGVSELINENNVNMSVCTVQNIDDTLTNNQRSIAHGIESIPEMQDSIIRLDTAQKQKEVLSNFSSNITSQNESNFSSEMSLSSNNSATMTCLDETMLQINNDACSSEGPNQSFLLNFEIAQDNRAILGTQYSLNEQTLIHNNAATCDDDVILSVNTDLSISSCGVESFVPDITKDNERMSRSQCLEKSQACVNKDPSTYNDEFMPLIKNAGYCRPLTENQQFVNNFDASENNGTAIQSEDILELPTSIYENESAVNDELQTNNNTHIFGSEMQSSSVDLDGATNSQTTNPQYLLTDPVNQVLPLSNDKTIGEMNNNKYISTSEDNHLLLDLGTQITEKATSMSLSLEDDSYVYQDASSNIGNIIATYNGNVQINSVNSAQAIDSVFVSQPNLVTYNGERTLGQNIDGSMTETQMPLVNFDVAQTSQEILQSLLSDEALPSVAPSSISKKDNNSDTLRNVDEEKILLKLLSKRNLKYLMQSDEGHFSCDLCPAKFTRKGHFNDHKEIHERDSLWICDICNKVFSSKKSIKLHIKYHNEKRTQCKVCGVVRHPLSMRNHMRKHNNDMPYTCPICKQTFRNTSTRNYHVKVKHIKDFKGSQSSIVNLISDIVDNEAVRDSTEIVIPLILPSLNKTSKMKKKQTKTASKSKQMAAKTQTPKLTSDPITNFACECGMLFKHKISLKLHKHKYNNQPHECNFSCNICNEVFSSKSWLTRHRRTARHKYNENKTKEM